MRNECHKRHISTSTNWSFKRINWTAIAAIVALITSILTWVISVEVRFARQEDINSVTQRIVNIEKLMTPMLVDWKVKQELKKYGIDINPIPPPEPRGLPPGDGEPSITPIPQLPPLTKLEDGAKRWAENAVQQIPLEKN